MTDEKLEILVLEDKHGEVAENALTELGLKPHIVGDLEAFMKEVENPNYGGAILDLNFPRKQGEKAELLGYEAGKIAEQHGLPRVYLTGGYFHHTTELAKIFLDEETAGGNAPAKDKPEAWKMAYEKLPPEGTMRATVTTKKRYMRATGKAYKAK